MAAVIFGSNTFTFTSTTEQVGGMIVGAAVGNKTDIVGKNFYLKTEALSAEGINGDGQVRVRIFYRLVDVTPIQ